MTVENIYSLKGNKRIKIQVMDLKKVFAKHVYDKIFRSRICKELSNNR